MSSPMWDIPEHFPIEVDKNGNGPAELENTVAIVCWCGDDSCKKYLEEGYEG